MTKGRSVLVVAGVVAVVLGALALPSATSAAAGKQVVHAPLSSVDHVPVFSPALNFVGTVDLAQAAARHHGRRPAGEAFRAVDDAILEHGAAQRGATGPTVAPTPVSTANVAGEHGFDGLGGIQQAETTGGLDLEPPDQGLCAGAGDVVEFINNALAVYDLNGDQLLAPVGSAALFAQPTTDFFSDPRCYFDSFTKRWFLSEFIVGTTNAKGQLVSPSVQFLSVSETADPVGAWDVWSFDTSDTRTSGCPCFGDYDELGADRNGIYITTDEFGISTPAFNGVIVYAVSKGELETAAQTSIVPPVFGYRLTKDAFGSPYIVAPASTPPGGVTADDTEYFVESNGDAGADHHLLVYALHDTSVLAAPAPPTLYVSPLVATERYAFPPDATQKTGPIPLGRAYQAPEGVLEADFDAAMEPTFTAGNLYAELDTGTSTGDAADWFILHPALTGTTLAVTVVHQGVVAVAGANLLYPYTAVDAQGLGYLGFAIAGHAYYPSPAYITYGAAGPTGPVRMATAGAGPDDGFTCYAAFVGPDYGGCRWGDYSMGAVLGSRVVLATEMVPPGARDTLTNWGTYIWSAPAPTTGGPARR